MDIEELKGLLLSYTRQICCAMIFMEKKGYVHRDLAARNVLITKDGTTCKVYIRTEITRLLYLSGLDRNFFLVAGSTNFNDL